jgi:MFS family permease
MAKRETELDVGELFQNRPLGRFQLTTLVLCILTLFVGGLHYGSVMPFTFDDLGWGFASFLIGSVLFGAAGDRFGRKAGAIAAVLTYSIPALLMAFGPLPIGLVTDGPSDFPVKSLPTATPFSRPIMTP